MAKEKITTIKLSENTKKRIDKLRVHKRETYDEILQHLLGILNTLRVSPENARTRLINTDKQHKSMA